MTPLRVKSIAVLTSGGDAPGMNAAIRSVVRMALANGCQVTGVLKGFSGLIEGLFQPMVASSVANIIQRGGTILKTDRCPEFRKRAVRRRAAELLKKQGIHALVVIGGDGSFTGAHLLECETGFPVISVPGTIDNDIYGTDETIGFDTAVNAALQAIDRIRDTASSHDRIFLVEVMGRDSGFIGLYTGIGGGAETLVLPEKPISISAICSTIRRGVRRGKSSSIIVVSEGRRSGQTSKIARELKLKGFASRVCILGHIQRGGSPTARDRLHASTLGAAAVASLLEGKSNSMVGIRGGEICQTPLSRALGKKKPMPTALVRLAKVLST